MEAAAYLNHEHSQQVKEPINEVYGLSTKFKTWNDFTFEKGCPIVPLKISDQLHFFSTTTVCISIS